MNDVELERLRESMSTYDDRSLTAILTIESSSYRSEAINVAEAELEARGISSERLQEFRLFRQQQDRKAETAHIDELRANGLTPQDLAAVARGTVTVGAMCTIGGIVVTFGSYVNAAPGGTYVITWGAILFGIGQVLHGLEQRRKAALASVEAEQ